MKFLRILFKARLFLLILFLDFLFYLPVFLNPLKVISGADIQIVYSSYKLFFADSVRHYLELPLWNPYVLGGQPFLANPSSGMLYPLNFLFVLFSPDFVFGYMFVINTALIGIFTYLYSRAIKISSFGSLISATIFMFCGTITSRVYPGHLFIIDALVWFPLILFALEKIIQTKKIIYMILASLSAALMILAGHSQISFYVIFISFCYVFLRVLFENKKNLRSVFLLSVTSLFFGLSIASVQLLPSFEFSKLSVRSIGLSYSFATDFSLYPYHLLTLFLPNFYGNSISSTFWGKGNEWELWLYVGILPLIFSLFAVLLKRNKYTYTFFCLFLFSLLFSLGKYFFVFSIFFKFVPFFENFRVPSRMLFLFTFSLAILSGIGIDRLLEKVFYKDTKIKIINFLTLLSSVFVSILLIFLNMFNGFALFEKFVLKNSYAVGINHQKIYEQIVFDLQIFALITIIYFALYFLLKNKKATLLFFKIAILVIIFLNLYLYLSKYVVLSDPKDIYNSNKIIETLKDDNGIFRVLDLSRENYVMVSYRNKLQNATGVDAIFLSSYRNFIWNLGDYKFIPYDSYIELNSIKNLKFLNILNVKYVITNKETRLDGFTLVKKDKINKNVNYLYENKGYFPRAFLSPNILLSGNKKQIEKVNIDYYSPNKIVLKTNVSQYNFLTLSESWYPGWKAYDNGKEIPILKTDNLFRSVYLKKGNHTVEFVFDPFSYKLGKFISLISISALLLLIVLKYKFRFIYVYKQKLKLLRLL